MIGVAVSVTTDIDDARTYTEPTGQYWQIPDHDHSLVDELHRHWDRPRSPGRRYLAFADGVYRRAGFVKRSALTIFAAAPLWSRSH
jgi:hypothetical protein